MWREQTNHTISRWKNFTVTKYYEFLCECSSQIVLWVKSAEKIIISSFCIINCAVLWNFPRNSRYSSSAQFFHQWNVIKIGVHTKILKPKSCQINNSLWSVLYSKYRNKNIFIKQGIFYRLVLIAISVLSFENLSCWT